MTALAMSRHCRKATSRLGKRHNPRAEDLSRRSSHPQLLPASCASTQMVYLDSLLSATAWCFLRLKQTP